MLDDKTQVTDDAASDMGQPDDLQAVDNGQDEDMVSTRPLLIIDPDEDRVKIGVGDTDAAERTPYLYATQRCHVGAIRNRNEDSSMVITGDGGGQVPLPLFGLYVVADGMGGHYAGHEASKAASRLISQRVLSALYLPLLAGDSSAEPVQEILVSAVKEANRRIHNPDPTRDMGTTLTAALVLGKRLYLAHVGDSRAYLFHGEQLEQLTTDHSYVQRLQDAGQLTADQAAIHPQRNVLYRAVGQGGEIDVDTYTCSLPKSGKLILCSDGLWGLVQDPDLSRILASSASLEGQADQLVQLALEAGGHDNITVVLVEFAI